jgi:hypothetical protein
MSNYGSIREFDDQYDAESGDVHVVQVAGGSRKRYIATAALLAALFGVVMLVVSSIGGIATTPTKFTEEIPAPLINVLEEPQILALSEDTETTESWVRTLNPTPVHFPATHNPTPRGLHPTEMPTEAPVEVVVRKALHSKNSYGSGDISDSATWKKTRNPTPANFPLTRNPTPKGLHPTELPTEAPVETVVHSSKAKKATAVEDVEAQAGTRTLNPTPINFPRTLNPTPRGLHPTEMPTEAPVELRQAQKTYVKNEKVVELGNGIGKDSADIIPNYLNENEATTVVADTVSAGSSYENIVAPNVNVSPSDIDKTGAESVSALTGENKNEIENFSAVGVTDGTHTSATPGTPALNDAEPSPNSNVGAVNSVNTENVVTDASFGMAKPANVETS